MTYKRWKGPLRPVANGASALRVTLSSDEDAPAHARAAVARVAPGATDDVLERARLLTSEVVTNSVRHAGSTEVRLEVSHAGDWIAVVVCDDGPGFEPSEQPARMPHSGGFGLSLLDTLSAAWASGWDHEAWVWFEVSPELAG